jgi:hypothetical protein
MPKNTRRPVKSDGQLPALDETRPMCLRFVERVPDARTKRRVAAAGLRELKRQAQEHSHHAAWRTAAEAVMLAHKIMAMMRCAGCLRRQPSGPRSATISVCMYPYTCFYYDPSLKSDELSTCTRDRSTGPSSRRRRKPTPAKPPGEQVKSTAKCQPVSCNGDLTVVDSSITNVADYQRQASSFQPGLHIKRP